MKKARSKGLLWGMVSNHTIEMNRAIIHAVLSPTHDFIYHPANITPCII